MFSFDLIAAGLVVIASAPISMIDPQTHHRQKTSNRKTSHYRPPHTGQSL